ncbi:transglutaminase-like domain-containing protein [Chengkuizengella axinellae]|uniref:Transglutaminase-like domain-containing protein n=1 Tax=Chengkuizengella axinellae TaxID=3064388 RepID=A0ABT9IUP0_9BACL|nr:transglutaminase-like domain-containing protein [Chengkuizengella sp. 2205SS18-9]MDP5273027.1 transglutaminase-like domain-containing protein [Chengkuizengella sp. 2205SS18-9]
MFIFSALKNFSFKFIKHPQLFKKLNLLLWGIFLVQYVEWVSVYWWESTGKIVDYALFILIAAEIFINKLLYKRLFQVIGILSAHYYVIGFQTIEYTEGFFIPAVQWLFANVIHLHPYIWFSVVIGLIYFILLSWVTSFKKIGILILLTIIVFCSVDSFTVHILWDQVAFIILSGLLLLIINHYHHFKAKHPKSWSEIMDYPESFVTPIIVFVSVTITLGSMAPGFGPLLTDPYTAWKNAKEAAAMGQGEGLLIDENTTSTSGYSRNNEVLGFGFEFDYSSIMRVESPQRSYWRGETRSVYNGSGWELNEYEAEMNSAVFSSENSLSISSKFNTSKLTTKEVEQKISMINDENYPVLFGAASIKSILTINEDIIENNAHAVSWDPNQQSLFWTSNEYPESYTIISEVPAIEPEKLREASTVIGTEEVMNAYLQLPENVPERVKGLAAQITENETNDYDKVKQIETYLYETYPYTNKPDLSKGKSLDFVDRFLFEIEEGYCDYYSTAMVVMTRSLGIPARWVKGYTSGEEDFEDEYDSFIMEKLMQNDNFDDFALGYTVRNSNAHSWVEVYFDGYGWIPFEPTAGFYIPEVYLPNLSSSTDTNAFDLSDEENLASNEEQFNVGDLGFNTIVSILFLILLAFIIVIKFGAIRVYLRRIVKITFRKTTNEKVVFEFEKFLKFANKKGYGKKEHETIRELISSWKSTYYWMENDFDELIMIFERAKYSTKKIETVEAQKALHILTRLKKGFFK